MRATMWRQPSDLEALLADEAPVVSAARKLQGRTLLLVGTGTSWHAANHGVWLLRGAGVDAWAVQAMDAALWGPRIQARHGVVLLSHRNTKRYGSAVLARARESGAECVVVAGKGAPGADVETVAQERSAAFTASHLGALLRLCQLARALGASPARLERVPGAVSAALEDPPLGVAPPRRFLQYTGAGTNAWTAAEGALKLRETARLAAEGLPVEQLLHGPAVALGPDDGLIALDGGGPGADRLASVARAAEASGVAVARVAATELGEELSIFPLTVAIQRVALELAERLGRDPDAFGFDVPGRRDAWEGIEL
jgi:glutamine---fructose-6-phosphate transaminase (isomerizing)